MPTWVIVLLVVIAIPVAVELIPEKRTVHEIDASDRLQRVIGMLVSHGMPTAWLHIRDQRGAHTIELRRGERGYLSLVLGADWVEDERRTAEDAIQNVVGDARDFSLPSKQVEAAIRGVIGTVGQRDLPFVVSLEGPYNFLSDARSSLTDLRALLSRRKR